MILLLDTNSFIWTISDINKLGRRAAQDIANPKNRVYVSDISLLECAIRVRTGKLKTKINFLTIDEFLAEINIEILPFDAWSSHHYIDLPHMKWADPFDLALIAQAISKHMILVTSDQHILTSSSASLSVQDARK